jgi:hypothetical protein
MRVTQNDQVIVIVEAELVREASVELVTTNRQDEKLRQRVPNQHPRQTEENEAENKRDVIEAPIRHTKNESQRKKLLSSNPTKT